MWCGVVWGGVGWCGVGWCRVVWGAETALATRTALEATRAALEALEIVRSAAECCLRMTAQPAGRADPREVSAGDCEHTHAESFCGRCSEEGDGDGDAHEGARGAGGAHFSIARPRRCGLTATSPSPSPSPESDSDWVMRVRAPRRCDCDWCPRFLDDLDRLAAPSFGCVLVRTWL